ncbi:MAG: hypothetical protein V3V99_02830 [candidate division Zixibacteria bacterium]
MASVLHIRPAEPSQRGRQEFHVRRNQEEQVCPEKEAKEAVTEEVAEKIEEDDVGDDD